MKKFLILIVFLFTLTGHSQITAKISDFHTIEVEDTLIQNTLEKYTHYMETNPINYEKSIRKFKSIKMVKKDRYFVGKFKDGVLYLNKRLNNYPNTKRVLILQYLALENGMKVYNKATPHVNSRGFNINSRNEELFKRQFVRDNPYRFVVNKLKDKAPLRFKY